MSEPLGNCQDAMSCSWAVQYVVGENRWDERDDRDRRKRRECKERSKVQACGRRRRRAVSIIAIRSSRVNRSPLLLFLTTLWSFKRSFGCSGSFSFI